ncbi:NADH-quinone oxidoreductase subunit C [Streptomonospora wellingtoniae]|uniref:NADH-quinone oxidoreductase subunit C n=1 Tax=Streptomonospora wellingtoniae TaxID=3075544 RepID=A0ABU2KMW0_9ACTN|nr:NADH-quinone oxidoreductase subunit C [Streptomonospora sp. DSM 45055]MDT0300532.1 NADH-quinone oxidoreductase subunit C [Streptomonospora sp. DSM 45055]
MSLNGNGNGNGPDRGEEHADQEENLPARAGEERLSAPVARTGMFGAKTSGDTSGYGGLLVRKTPRASSRRPFTDPDDPRTESFDGIADALERALGAEGAPGTRAVERVLVDRGEITFHVRRENLREVARLLRDDPGLRFELCTGVSGVHFPDDSGRELHAVYHLRSLTHNNEIRVETACPDADPHIPSVVAVYPANDWHEREAFDFFGIVFDGHPALTRIEMPDDWHGHPQRKDYPLGGIPVEYRGATIPPPDERRSYQ